MYYFLINPSARSKKGFHTWKKIEKYLKEEKIIYQTILTKNIEEVIHAARNLTADEEEKTVVLLGGDGTLNAFLNGMQQTRSISLACLPIGSGNDFARGMQITKNYEEEIYLILHDKQKRKVHYGIVSYPSGREERFFVSAGIGYDAKVCDQVERSPWKKILNLFGIGHSVFLLEGLRGLLQARFFGASLSIDRENVLDNDRFLFASFHMLPYEGGGFKFCPGQRPENNRLHICAVEGISKLKLPFIIPQALIGTHIFQKGVHQFECQEAEIKTSQSQYVHTDGEIGHKYDRISVRVSNDTVTFLN